MRRAPQPPKPPALATAMASKVGQAPAIGAIRIGTRRLKVSQNVAALISASCRDMQRDHTGIARSVRGSGRVKNYCDRGGPDGGEFWPSTTPLTVCPYISNGES